MTKFLAITSFILLLACSGLGYLLKQEYKTTGKLSGEITSLSEKLAACSSEKEKFILDQKSTDNLLTEALEKQEAIEDVFADLKNKLNKQRCPTGASKNEDREDSSDVAVTLGTVRLLLDKAACTANSNCPSSKPSESPPTQL
jgi:hypothetical protein